MNEWCMSVSMNINMHLLECMQYFINICNRFFLRLFIFCGILRVWKICRNLKLLNILTLSTKCDGYCTTLRGVEWTKNPWLTKMWYVVHIPILQVWPRENVLGHNNRFYTSSSLSTTFTLKIYSHFTTWIELIKFIISLAQSLMKN